MRMAHNSALVGLCPAKGHCSCLTLYTMCSCNEATSSPYIDRTAGPELCCAIMDGLSYTTDYVDHDNENHHGQDMVVKLHAWFTPSIIFWMGSRPCLLLPENASTSTQSSSNRSLTWPTSPAPMPECEAELRMSFGGITEQGHGLTA